jgi:hypothetical protein
MCSRLKQLQKRRVIIDQVIREEDEKEIAE